MGDPVASCIFLFDVTIDEINDVDLSSEKRVLPDGISLPYKSQKG